MRRVNGRGPVYYEFDQWAGNDRLAHGVFTRLGGVSTAPWASLNVGSTVGDRANDVERNKQLMYDALGVDSARVCTVWQVHGAETVVWQDSPQPDANLQQADGMVTDQWDLPLVMRFADCVPILFYDPIKTVIGLAHAGWRGTIAGAGASVVRQMVETYGCRPQDIQAGIGPSIGPETYQVGPEVVSAVQAAFRQSDGLIRVAPDGSSYLNLWEANRRTLQKAGLTDIEVAGICTASHNDEFFSHRAEAGTTGRFGAVILLRS